MITREDLKARYEGLMAEGMVVENAKHYQAYVKCWDSYNVFVRFHDEHKGKIIAYDWFEFDDMFGESII
jgi:hypothetical protein